MTNKIVQRTIEQFMNDYEPTYKAMFPLFMKKKKKYESVVGTLDFKRLTTIGDIRNRHIEPKDTEIKEIHTTDSKKSYKRYFFASQYVVSDLQDNDGLEGVVKEVLDEHNKHQDDLFLLGEGSSASTMLNNGLFWSDDVNYVLENSVEVQKGTAADHLKDMYAKIMGTTTKSDDVAGEKILLLYGSTAISKFNSLFENTDNPFSSVLREALEDWSIAKMPTDVTPAGANGWLAANLDQIMTHYTELPSLKRQGVNDEKMYSWYNFLQGSMMVEVLAQKGIIRQPVTFQA